MRTSRFGSNEKPGGEALYPRNVSPPVRYRRHGKRRIREWRKSSVLGRVMVVDDEGGLAYMTSAKTRESREHEEGMAYGYRHPHKMHGWTKSVAWNKGLAIGRARYMAEQKERLRKLKAYRRPQELLNREAQRVRDQEYKIATGEELK